MDEQCDKSPIIAECSRLIFEAVAPDSDGPLSVNNHLCQVDGCEERRIAFLPENKAEFVNAQPGDFPPPDDGAEDEDGGACAEPRMLTQNQGFVPVGRQVYECPYFVRGHKEYSYWLFDLYGQAEFKDTTKLTFKYHKLINLKRGQFYTAFRYLAKRWGVSTNKVRAFLKNMEAVGQIETQSESDGTIITLLHYGGCKSLAKSTEPHDETHSDTRSETDMKRS